MALKKYSFILSITLSSIFCIFLCGCKSLLNTPAQDKVYNKIDTVESAHTDLISAHTNKLSLISDFSYGIHYALKDVESNEVTSTVNSFNNRILSLSGYPSVDKIRDMEELVDNLISKSDAAIATANKQLKNKDDEIMQLNSKIQSLQSDLVASQQQLKMTILNTAKQADSNQALVDTVNKWFGLGGVIYGLKKFTSTFCIVGICLLFIYLILRILSSLNPIANSIFNVFETIISYVIKFVKFIAPNSTSISGYSETSEVNKYKNTLEKIVDTIETLQANLDEDKKGKITLTEIMNGFSINMDSNDKNVINNIKSELKW